MKTRAFTSALAVTALAAALAGCASDTDKVTTDDGVNLIEDGKLTVCTHMPYEPFQYKEGGEIVGFDVDLMDLVAQELDLEQKIFDTPFEGIETGQAMSTGKCDIAAAAPPRGGLVKLMRCSPSDCVCNNSKPKIWRKCPLARGDRSSLAAFSTSSPKYLA